jgi:SAM-dependent methyltransferase
MNMDTSKGSPERFGYSWDRFSELTPAQERQFQLWTTPIDLVIGWRGSRFLDAGCGMGRNTYWPMKHGARSAVAIDLDDRSLERARRNLAQFPEVTVQKGSIYDIPYENEFDIAFSIGVIHHLEQPDTAIAQLVKATKAGGKVLIWVYGYENLEFYVNVLNPIRKALFSKMPLSLVRLIAYLPAAILWVMLKLGIRPIAYLKLLSGFPFRHLHHIVFDQMLPQTANYWTKDQALALFQRAGLKDIQAHWINDCSWTLIGIKP